MLELNADTKEAIVLSAGLKTFLDYGFKRTTMDDIARAAGMSRPALYLVFKNKKDIFRACIIGFTDQLKNRLDEIVASNASAEESTYAVLTAGIVEPFHLLAQTAHGPEIFDIKSDLAADLFEEWMRTLEMAITSILQRTVADGSLDLTKTDMKPAQIAAVIVDGAEGIKIRMGEDGDIEGRIKALLGLILRPLVS